MGVLATCGVIILTRIDSIISQKPEHDVSFETQENWYGCYGYEVSDDLSKSI